MQYWDRMVDLNKRSRGRERQDPRRLKSTSETFEQKRLFERTDSEAGPQKSFLDESVTVPGLFPTDRSPGSRDSSSDPNGIDKKIAAAVDAIVFPEVITDHGDLTGLSDDDHGIYLNNARGDIRYFREVEHLNTSAGASDAGKPIKLNASGLVDPTMIPTTGIDHGLLAGLTDDDHTQYLLADGTRAMSGNLDMGTNAITNVGNVDGRDVSADGAELDIIERMFDGIIVETIDIDIVVESTVVKLQLQADGGGDLTCRFAGVSYTLDCTPPLKVNLTDGADDENPVLNYVFITESAGVLTLGANTTGFPASAYCPVATVFVQSDGSVVVDGVYKNHAWVDHMNDPDGNGHLQDINAKLRGLNADYVSGIAPSDLVVSSPDAYISTTAGVIRQVHDQVMPAIDMQTPAPIFVINDPTTPYKRITTFDDITQDASGGAINNKYMNLILVAVASENPSECKLYLLLPTDTYVVEAAAIADTEQTTVYAFPSEFIGTAALVARYTVQAKDSGAWSQSQKVDLRGTYPSTAAGGGGITDHGSLFGLTDDDHTQYILADGTRPLTGDWDVGSGQDTITVERFVVNQSSSFDDYAFRVLVDGSGLVNVGKNQTSGKYEVGFVGDNLQFSATESWSCLSVAAGAMPVVFGELFGQMSFTVGCTGAISLVSGTSITLGSGTGIADLNSGVLSTVTKPAGDLVGTTATQTLTNKTLTAPTIADFTNAAHDHGDTDDGGKIHVDYRTHSSTFYIQTPIAADSFVDVTIPKGATLKYASYITDTGTVTFNVEIRNNATPFTSGTDIWSGDKTATSSSANTASFDNASITARQILHVAITGVASSPTEFQLYLEWEVD